MFEIDYVDKEKIIDTLSSLMDGLTEEVHVKEFELGAKTQLNGSVEAEVGHAMLLKGGGKAEGTYSSPENSSELVFTAKETDASLLRKLYTRMEPLLVGEADASGASFCELEGDIMLSPFQEAMQILALLQDAFVASAKDGKTNVATLQKVMPLIFDEKDAYLLMHKSGTTFVFRANKSGIRENDFARLCGPHKVLGRVVKQSKEGDEQSIYSPKLNIASMKAFDIRTLIPLLAQMGYTVSEADLKVKHPFVLVQAYAIYQRTEV